MYYTIEHENNDYKIKIKYDKEKKEYCIEDILLLSGDREPSKALIEEIETRYPEMIAEMGYADGIIQQKLGGLYV